MSRGGFRPGAGRNGKFDYYVDGTRFNSLSDAAEVNGVSKQTIHRWCKGKRENCWTEPKKGDTPADSANKADITPLDFMLQIMRDENEDIARRDRMCRAPIGEKC